MLKEELARAKQVRKLKLCISRDRCTAEGLMRRHNNGIKREEKYFKKLFDSWNGCKDNELFV